VVVAASCATAWVLACGPFVTDLRPVTSIVPAEYSAYAAGDIGVVRPRFGREYLFLAYRVLSGQTAAVACCDERRATEPRESRPVEELRNETLGEPGKPRTNFDGYKWGPDYVFIENCPRHAFETALRTRDARVQRFGVSSPEVREWTRGQAAVFENCSGKDLVLPPDVPPDIDPVIRADRAYQTAAAFFYAMQYDEAAKRFAAISSDKSSPWKPYGRYLAARAKIRQGTVFDEDKTRSSKLLNEATAELNAVLQDTEAAALHDSARGLLNFVRTRTDPIARARELSVALTRESAPRAQDVRDYVFVMNRLVGDTVDWDYASLPEAPNIASTSDLNDWVLAMQGGGDAAAARAVARWKETKTIPWLVAALWKVPSSNPSADELLNAAAAIDRNSPAYPNVAFLRVRLLAQRGERAGARALLSTLPVSPDKKFGRESINLLRAERLQLAARLEDVLMNAPRYVVDDVEGRFRDTPIFDEDAAAIFSQRLPLKQLVDASQSPILPTRLRQRVAVAAFARAVLLRRDDQGLRVASVLRELAPGLIPDLDRYHQAATPDDRHRAGIILLLRTPGMSTQVRGIEDDAKLARDQPSRTFDHLFRDNWWCGPQHADDRNTRRRSVVIDALYPGTDVQFPEFVTDDQRATAQKELADIASAGSGKRYLASEAIAWAKERPTDSTAAEALALAVEGWRWSCWDEEGWQTSRTAFQTLHRQFPQSEWARKTRYWYK
jgi:hypothetical protein